MKTKLLLLLLFFLSSTAAFASNYVSLGLHLDETNLKDHEFYYLFTAEAFIDENERANLFTEIEFYPKDEFSFDHQMTKWNVGLEYKHIFDITLGVMPSYIWRDNESNGYGMKLYGKKRFFNLAEIEFGRQLAENSLKPVLLQHTYGILSLNTPVIKNQYVGLFSIERDLTNKDNIFSLGVTTTDIGIGDGYFIRGVLGVKHDESVNKTGAYVETTFTKLF
jgi:hypothetical protein